MLWLLVSTSLLAPAEPGFKPGKIYDGTAENGVTFHVRVPKGHGVKKPFPAIVILHGSNMNSKVYLLTILNAWPRLAASHILVGIDGEKRVEGSPDENPRYNYTYLNFAGRSKYKGYPGTDRESPALIAEVVRELQKKIGFRKVIIGGHSQGGSAAYSCFMNFPDLFAGAFPASCELVPRCAPDAYEDPEIRSRQREGAMAIVHGKNDPVLPFNMAEKAYNAFEEDGFLPVRLFSHKEAAHLFARLPMEEAVGWIEGMTSEDPRALLAFAELGIRKGRFRDAFVAADRARNRDAGKRYALKITRILKGIDRQAAARGKVLGNAMLRSRDGSWMDSYFDFRTQFGHRPGARKVLDLFQKLRDLHEKPATELWNASKESFRTGKTALGNSQLREIVEKYYASSWYRSARRLIEERIYRE